MQQNLFLTIINNEHVYTAGLLMNAAWLQIMGKAWKQYSILV